MPQPVRFYIFLAIAIVVLFVIGSFTSVQGVEIGSCKATWYSYTKKVTSDLCPNATVECDAEPYKQQHNALVEMIACACSIQNRDVYTNERISDTYYQMTGMNLTGSDVCSSPLLTRWSY